jgi:hypothetical protein
VGANSEGLSAGDADGEPDDDDAVAAAAAAATIVDESAGGCDDAAGSDGDIDARAIQLAT